MKYRKKPVTVSAYHFDGGLRRLCAWLRHVQADPSDVVIKNGLPYIHTLEGDMRVDVGDYVIKGVRGELYPCKSDVFEATYEEVKDAARGRSVDDAPDETGGMVEAAA